MAMVTSLAGAGRGAWHESTSIGALICIVSRMSKSPRATGIFVGLVIGATLGVLANTGLGPTDARLMWVNDHIAGPVGAIFLRMLFMVVIPLVFSSIVMGIASIGDVRAVGRLGGKTLAWFVASTAVASVVGLVAVLLLHPGSYVSAEVRDALLKTYQAGAAEKVAVSTNGGMGMQFLVDMVPKNPLKAAVDGDMLAVLVFAAMFGIALATLPASKRRPMADVLETLNDVCTKLVAYGIRIAPLGVAALAFGVTSRFGLSLLVPLFAFIATVMGGLAFHAVVMLGGALRVAGISPWWFFLRTRTSLLTAFSTSSSSATLPTNLRTATQDLGIPAPIAGFVLPVGSTMCMNGTALFEGVTVLFLCQVFGVELSLMQQVTVLVLAVVTAIGAAGVPGGSIPLLIGILVQVGVPAEGIAVVLGVDRLLDMCRTTVNVWGDLAVTALIARSEGWRPGEAMVRDVAPGDAEPLS
jgi:dicarboxylate/amino acid:cation (Na+ or H+) symporter, DAACS family